MRLHLEAQSHLQSCFITLTYDEENIPDANSLQPVDLQRFIKRLRKHTWPTHVRYYGCGEYGDGTERPHYHIIIFGYDFPDRRVHVDRGDYTIDNSRILSRLWPYGHATVQDNSIEAGAYVAKYAVKKITGEKADDYYRRIDIDTGEIYQLVPEFARMSRRPGIGSDWLRKYYKDLFPKGYVTNGKGIKMPPPEYFNKLYQKWFPEAWEKLREEKRQDKFDRHANPEPDRAKAREIIQKAKLNLRKGGKI